MLDSSGSRAASSTLRRGLLLAPAADRLCPEVVTLRSSSRRQHPLSQRSRVSSGPSLPRAPVWPRDLGGRILRDSESPPYLARTCRAQADGCAAEIVEEISSRGRGHGNGVAVRGEHPDGVVGPKRESMATPSGASASGLLEVHGPDFGLILRVFHDCEMRHNQSGCGPLVTAVFPIHEARTP